MSLRYNRSVSRLRRLFVAGKIFFITNNLLRARTPFTERDFGALAAAFLRVRRRRTFLLTGYVFMPDHWHALLFPAEADTLPRLMDALKVASTRGINRARQNGPLWQSRYYDHAIRSVKEYHDTLTYMHFNPVRKVLVQRPEDWPWSSIHSYGGPGPVRLEVDRLDLPLDERTPL
jgi:putative transposase